MDEALTLREACSFLKISRPTLLELANRQKIPCRKVGRQWRFLRSALADWLAGKSVSVAKRKVKCRSEKQSPGAGWSTSS